MYKNLRKPQPEVGEFPAQGRNKEVEPNGALFTGVRGTAQTPLRLSKFTPRKSKFDRWATRVKLEWAARAP